MDVISAITIILLFGLIFSKIAKVFKVPYIIGYLFAGILIGPSLLNLITTSQTNNFESFSAITLAFLSFMVGAELKVSYIKRIGYKSFVTALFISLTTFLVISVGMYIVIKDLPSALILGCVAATSAPAVIMNIFKDYDSKGNLTNTILGVIAVDDIISVLLFGIIITMLKSSDSTFTFLSLLMPFKEILLSIILGLGLGILLGFLSKLFKNKYETIALVLAFILASITLTNYISVSSLLVCTVMGIFFTNFFKGKVTNNLLNVTDELLSLTLIIFFVSTGTILNISLIPQIWIISLIFIVIRLLGKYFGAIIGMKVSKSEVDKSLGLCLLSQTGLSIGLVLASKSVLGPYYLQVQGIVVFTSIITDIISPIILKSILVKHENIVIKKKLFNLKKS